jgi:hypothetical protein
MRQFTARTGFDMDWNLEALSEIARASAAFLVPNVITSTAAVKAFA